MSTFVVLVYIILFLSSVSFFFFFFFSSRRRHTRCSRDWSSDVCSSDLLHLFGGARAPESEVRLPGAAEWPAVRADVDGLPRPEREGQARQRVQGSARRHHPRGRRVRRRRLEGQ